MPDAPDTLRDGRYAIVRVLGEGGQATTFEAVDKQVGRAVAIKRFRVRGAASWKEVELAEREARVLASIDHPALPRYVDHFEEGGELFLVTEKIEGESLAALKKRGAAFSEDDAVRFLRDASEALDYLHRRAPPIIHRDIKPSNVIRRPDGSFALIDFGAVRDRMKPEGGSTVVGTFGYMAPEQFQGRALPASDVYAVASTTVAMLSGREPEDLPHRGLAIDVAAALAGTRTSPALVRLLGEMLEPDPDERPAAIAPGLSALGHEARDERAENERRRDGDGGGLFGSLIFAVVVLALSLAELAVTVALRALVPVVLTLLSLVLGKGLRRAAENVGRSGKQAAAAIARARVAVRGGDRVRIDVADATAEEDAAVAEDAAAAERGDQRRRRR